METRTKVVRTVAVLGIAGAIAAGGVFSAFTSQTDNPGNVVTAGTVELTDNDAGSALYELTAAAPGDSETACIEVSYSGSLDADVRLYTPSAIDALGEHVDLTIQPGAQSSPSFPGCTGFAADGAAVYDGTLADFAAGHGDYATGIADFPGSTSAWETGDTVVYQVTATLAADAPTEMQGETTGTHTLRWEARNQ